VTSSKRNPKSLRVIFAGTPDFAADSLNALINSHHTVCAVFTQPDRKAGRGRKLNKSPVKLLAEEHSIPVYQPSNLKTEENQQQIQALNADVMVVAAYGLILPKQVLNMTTLGCINIHASLLPRWRGAAPIQRAILAGDTTTGITFMEMDEGLDTGGMLLKVECDIDSGETGGSLHDKLAAIGAKRIVSVLDCLAIGDKNVEQQQEQQACYAKKLHKAEALIDWCDKAEELEKMIRAFNPWPVAYTTIENHKSEIQNLRVWDAKVVKNESLTTQNSVSDDGAPGTISNTISNTIPGTIIESSKNGIVIVTGDGLLAITRLQLPGSKALSAEQVLNAKRELFKTGTKLG